MICFRGLEIIVSRGVVAGCCIVVARKSIRTFADRRATILIKELKRGKQACSLYWGYRHHKNSPTYTEVARVIEFIVVNSSPILCPAHPPRSD